MKSRKRNLSAYIILAFLYFAPVIDNFVGAAMRSTGEDTSLGKAYRLLFFVFLLIYYCTHTVKIELAKFTVIACTVIILPILYTFLHGTSAGMITDYIQLSKLFYPIVLYNVLNNMITHKRMAANDIYNCVGYYRWFYPLSLLVPYGLGLGYQSYEAYDAGYSGFYGAGNELSVVLVAMFIVSFYDTVNNKKKAAFVPSVMNMICILLTGSKTGMIMLVVGTIVIMLHSSNAKKYLFRVIELIVICVPIALGVLYLMQNQLNAIINMIQFKYNQLGRDFISFLFSNRNKKICPNFMNSIFDHKQGFINLFLGRGYYDQAVLHKTSINIASSGLIEMDLFDMFFQHGIIITIGVMTFYIKKLFGATSQNKVWGMKFAAGIIMLFGILAGHTFQSSLPATSLILLLICADYMVGNETIEKQR